MITITITGETGSECMTQMLSLVNTSEPWPVDTTTPFPAPSAPAPADLTSGTAVGTPVSVSARATAAPTVPAIPVAPVASVAPVPAEPVAAAVPAPVPVAQVPAPVPIAQVPAPAPVAAVPVAAAPTYTIEQLARATAILSDQNRAGEIQTLFGRFGISRLDALPKDAYGAYAAMLRQMGVQI